MKRTLGDGKLDLNEFLEFTWRLDEAVINTQPSAWLEFDAFFRKETLFFLMKTYLYIWAGWMCVVCVIVARRG